MKIFLTSCFIFFCITLGISHMSYEIQPTRIPVAPTQKNTIIETETIPKYRYVQNTTEKTSTKSNVSLDNPFYTEVPPTKQEEPSVTRTYPEYQKTVPKPRKRILNGRIRKIFNR